jgi:hypothetical protein
LWLKQSVSELSYPSLVQPSLQRLVPFEAVIQLDVQQVFLT